MTFSPTPKQAEVLRAIREAGEMRSVYALAQVLNRPYRRVLDHVRALEAAGLIEVEATPKPGRKAGRIRPTTPGAAIRP